jgi:predicted transposase/invertase (TIGR01784 family)
LEKDIITKEAIKTLVVDIAKYILEIDINNIEFIDKELLRVEDRRADVVAIIDNSYILHIEIQNNNDKNMHNRMLRYYTDIRFISKLPIKQYLVYIGRDRLNMQDKIIDSDINYYYKIIDMKNIDCEKFIKIDTPDSLVLAILCDFKDNNPQDVVNFIINRLHEKTNSDEREFRKYMIMLEELSENRNLLEFIKKGEEMLTQINYEKLPSFYLGLEKGIERGIERGLEEGIEKGLERGLERGKLESAQVMLELGIDANIIANRLGIDINNLISK